MPRIKVLDTFAVPVFYYDILKSLGVVTVYTDVPSDTETTLKRARGADVIVVNKTRLTKDVIERLEGVLFIAETASGYDNIDIRAAAARNIPVSNVPGYSTESVAEHVFALILSMCRKIPLCSETVRDGGWVEEPLVGTELHGKTIGVVGFGKIGRSVCRIARGFSMHVLACTRNPDSYRESFPDVEFVTLEEIMQRADVVSLHVPLSEETKGMIGKQTLECMKPGALLVNTARGGVIDESALLSILRQGRIQACLDVLSVEPPERAEEFEALPNVLVTPHVGWYTQEALDRLMRVTYDNISMFFAGSPRNVVNMDPSQCGRGLRDDY